jgi:hypothetical protein
VVRVEERMEVTRDIAKIPNNTNTVTRTRPVGVMMVFSALIVPLRSLQALWDNQGRYYVCNVENPSCHCSSNLQLRRRNYGLWLLSTSEESYTLATTSYYLLLSYY